MPDRLDPPPVDDAWRPMVMLRHARPGLADHVDWLLARDPSGAEPLWSFRTTARPDRLDPRMGPVTRPIGMRAIADHRSRYLTYEGEVSRRRGVVSRIGAGRFRVHVREADGITLEVDWDERTTMPQFVTIITKSAAPHGVAVADGCAPPPPEHDDEPIAWLVRAPQPR